MDVPECFYRISVKALVLDESRTKFLLTKEENGRWELPGGGLDHGAAVHDELRREIKEEMGLNVTWIANQPSYFLTSPRDVGDGHMQHIIANVIYETKLESLDFTPSDECIEVRLVTKEEASELDLFENVQAFVGMFQPANF